MRKNCLGQRILLVRAARGVHHITRHHAVTSQPSNVNAGSTQCNQVKLGVVGGLTDTRISEERSNPRKNRRLIQVRLWLRRADRYVDRLARLERHADAAQMRRHRIQ